MLEWNTTSICKEIKTRNDHSALCFSFILNIPSFLQYFYIVFFKKSLILQPLKPDPGQLIHQIIPQIGSMDTLLILEFKLPLRQIHFNLTFRRIIPGGHNAWLVFADLFGDCFGVVNYAALDWFGESAWLLLVLVLALEFVETDVNLCWLYAHDVLADVSFLLKVAELEL